MTVPREPITIGKTVTFMFHCFFNSLVRFRYLSLFSFSFNFTLWSVGTAKSTILQVLSFLLIITRSGRLAEYYSYHCLFFLRAFPHQRKLMVSNWSLSDSKSPQVSRTLLSILTDLNNAVVGMFSTRSVISKSSSPCTNPFVIVPRAAITIGTIVTFMFHTFFNSLARSRY